MKLLTLLRFTTIAVALSMIQALAEEPQYIVIPLKSSLANIQKAMSAFIGLNNKVYLPAKDAPIKHGLVVMGYLNPPEVTKLLDLLHEAPITKSPISTLNISLEASSPDTIDLKVTGQKIGDKPIEPLFTIWTTQTFVVLAPKPNESNDYQVFLVSPK